MKKRRTFRPVLFDRLEDRVVLSGVSAAVSANVNTSFQVQSINYAQVASAINQDFSTFRTSFGTQLNNFLNPVEGGTTITQSELQASTAQEIGQLVQQLQTTLIQIPGASTGLTPFITNEIEGAFGGDLLSILNSIPGSTGTNGAPSTLYAQVANDALNTTQLVVNDLLSTYAWGLAQGMNTFGSATTPQPINYAQVATQLNTNFNTFRGNFLTEENGFVNGGTTTLSQLQAFTTQNVGQLATQLQSDLGSISGASTGLTPFILNQVNGQFGGDMLSNINNVPGNTGVNNGPDALFTTATTNAINSTQLAANDLISVYNWGLSQGTNYVQLYTSGGNGNVIDQANLSTALSPTQLAIATNNVAQIKLAYMTFSSAFNNAVQNTLFANATPGTNGQVNLSANQGAFNSQVAQSLATLNTNLGNVFANTPGVSTSFLPSIEQSLMGSNGLQGQLGGLALPTDIGGMSATTFNTNSNTLLNQSFLDTVARTNLFGLNNNFNFNTYGSMGAFANGPYGAAFANFPTSTGTGLFASGNGNA